MRILCSTCFSCVSFFQLTRHEKQINDFLCSWLYRFPCFCSTSQYSNQLFHPRLGTFPLSKSKLHHYFCTYEVRRKPRVTLKTIIIPRDDSENQIHTSRLRHPISCLSTGATPYRQKSNMQQVTARSHHLIDQSARSMQEPIRRCQPMPKRTRASLRMSCDVWLKKDGAVGVRVDAGTAGWLEE